MTPKGTSSSEHLRSALPLPPDRAAARNSAEASHAPSVPEDPRRQSSLRHQHSELVQRPAASLTVLRGGRGCVHLAVATDGGFRVELRSRRAVLLSGPWEVTIRRDSQLVHAVSDWQQVLRHSDAKGDYLELELHLSHQVRLQRHIFLARNDRFAFLADAVIAHQPGTIEYQSRWQLAKKVRLEGARENWEAYLRYGKRRAVVLPLALPEWRCQDQHGQLLAADRSMMLCQARHGRSLLAPLFLDLKRSRFRRRLTWRQLTVAESLAAQDEDVAVGYRVAVGKRQWLIYRALAYCANRTVLGHNLVSEFLLARFYKSGKVKPLVEIAPESEQ